jgi:hypothetical protein
MKRLLQQTQCKTSSLIHSLAFFWLDSDWLCHTAAAPSPSEQSHAQSELNALNQANKELSSTSNFEAQQREIQVFVTSK